MAFEGYIVNCKTLNEAKVFLSFCVNNGCDWGEYTTQWGDYKNKTCYRFDSMKRIFYASLDFYASDSDYVARYNIVSFQEFMKLNRHLLATTSNVIEYDS